MVKEMGKAIYVYCKLLHKIKQQCKIYIANAWACQELKQAMPGMQGH